MSTEPGESSELCQVWPKKQPNLSKNKQANKQTVVAWCRHCTLGMLAVGGLEETLVLVETLD